MWVCGCNGVLRTRKQESCHGRKNDNAKAFVFESETLEFASRASEFAVKRLHSKKSRNYCLSKNECLGNVVREHPFASRLMKIGLSDE